MKDRVSRIHRTHTRSFISPKPNCNSSYKNKNDLSGHMRYRHGNRTLSCQHHGCDKMFVTESRRKRHQVTHTNEKQFLCLVDGCGKGLKNQGVYINTIVKCIQSKSLSSVRGMAVKAAT